MPNSKHLPYYCSLNDAPVQTGQPFPVPLLPAATVFSPTQMLRAVTGLNTIALYPVIGVWHERVAPPLQRPSTLQCCRTVPSKEAPNSTERQKNCGHSCQLLSRWQYNTMLVIDQRLMGFRSADQETSASFVGEASSAIPHNRR